ncbi:CRISPR-associated protein Cas5 [Candidatus Dojkabacteria bacterium]|nr:CRISPR-associated protein Cas5 [Candidatus Dojkabacteria bacterium]
MTNYLRFSLSGVFNSFKIPTFKTYHKTFLAPTRTHILGFLTNISRGSEKDYYDLLNQDIQVSVVIKSLLGETKDLWTFKSLKDSNHGRNVIRRVKNYRAKYIIYLKISAEEIFENLLTNLKNPQRIPSLGMDDEIVNITDVKKRNLSEVKEKRIDSVIPYKKDQDEFLDFNVQSDLKSNSIIIYPQDYLIHKSFKTEWKQNNVRGIRKPIDPIYIREFYNCTIELKEKIRVYKDKEKDTNLLFY